MSVKTEKMLLAADAEIKLNPRETGGSNRGPLVDKYLRTAGLDPTSGHYPWCASFIYYVALKGGFTKTQLPSLPAAVRNWVSWARDNEILTDDFSKVQRGDLGCWLDPVTNLGHVFAINEVKKGPLGMAAVRTSEGNTSESGAIDAPTDRDGDGAYKKWRIVRKNFKFIRLTQLP